MTLIEYYDMLSVYTVNSNSNMRTFWHKEIDVQSTIVSYVNVNLSMS